MGQHDFGPLSGVDSNAVGGTKPSDPTPQELLVEELHDLRFSIDRLTYAIERVLKAYIAHG